MYLHSQVLPRSRNEVGRAKRWLVDSVRPQSLATRSKVAPSAGRVLALLAIWQLSLPGFGLAQFVTSLPKPLPDAVAAADAIRGDFDRYLTNVLGHKPFTSDHDADQDAEALRSSERGFCATWQWTYQTKQAVCDNAIDAERMIERRVIAPSATEVYLKPGLPFSHRRGEVTRYLKSTQSGDGIRLFSRFAANVSDKEAYVVSDVISGLTGRMLFAINYAAVVVKDESSDSTTRNLAENDKATMVRMINNGGTIAARMQLPIHAQAGPTGQSASSVYATLGLIGPLGNTDSLRFAGSVNAEYAMALTIRDFSEAAGLLGDLILAGRVGYAFSEDPLVSTSDKKGVQYAQLAIGLRQNSNITLSALVTWALSDAFKPLTPRLIVNFAAIR